MAAKILQIAEAVKTALNGQTFGMPFTAVRAYKKIDEMAIAAEPDVIVSPGQWSGEATAADSSQTEHTVHVRIHKKLLKQLDNAEIDPLLTLADDVQAFLLGQYQDENATCTACNAELDEESLFTLDHFDCLLTATFQVIV